MSGFQNTPALRQRAKTYSSLSLDRVNSFNMANLFLLSQKVIKNFLFWRLSNECQIVLPALVSGPPNREKPYNKHLISLVFSVRNLQYGAKTRLIRGIFVVWYLCCAVCSFCDVVSSLCFVVFVFRYKALVPRLYSLQGTSQTGFKRGPSSCFRVVKDNKTN